MFIASRRCHIQLLDPAYAEPALGRALNSIQTKVRYRRRREPADDVRMMFRRLAMLALVAVAACAHLPPRDAVVSLAIPAEPGTRLGTLYAAAAAQHGGQSGFLVLDRGEQAWLARAAVIDLADRSIDAQYFDWQGDRVGKLLIDKVLHAADRGVRVRLLIDDLHTHGRGNALLALDAHPNIEVRVFNPFVSRAGRTLEWLRRFSNVNHRMHNKMLIVDGQALVFGGRNIADSYFGLDDQLDFRDLDMLAVGDVVPQAGRAFDAYWNSQWAFPIHALERKPPTTAQLAELTNKVRQDLATTYAQFPYRTTATPQEIMQRLDERTAILEWAPAELVYDAPGKMAGTQRTAASAAFGRGLALARGAQQEIVAEAAYYVPPKDLSQIRALRQRGVALHLLTNSLASTDLVPVHSAYARSRRKVVALGVELRELNAWASARAVYIARPERRTTLSLHAKVAVIDRATVFLGSVNLDPRSTYLNTEVAVAIASPALAAQVLAVLERDFADANSWRVVLDEDHGLRWHGVRDGVPQCRHQEPDASTGRRVKASMLALLPIRSLL